MQNKKQIFSWEDFPISLKDPERQRDEAVRIANAKIEKLMKSWPVAYGYGEKPGASSLWNMNGPELERWPHTHQARLAFIELIKPCEHEPDITTTTIKNVSVAMCIHCGVELVAEWSAK